MPVSAVTLRGLQFCLALPEFIDRIVKYIDRIKAFSGLDGPSLCFIDLSKREKHVKPIAFFGALGCSPAGLNSGERGFVIFLVRVGRTSMHRLL